MPRIRPSLGWKSDDDPTRAAHELHRLVGKDAAFLLYGSVWWVARYLDPRDRYKRNAIGQLREQQPWRRKIELLVAGRTLDECVFLLRGGAARTMVGRGFRPLLDKSGEWRGFVGPDGVELPAGVPFVGGAAS